MPAYRYRLIHFHLNSQRLGLCEVCGLWADDVCMQVAEDLQQDGARQFWAHRFDTFGHEDCLLAIRSGLAETGATS